MIWYLNIRGIISKWNHCVFPKLFWMCPFWHDVAFEDLCVCYGKSTMADLKQTEEKSHDAYLNIKCPSCDCCTQAIWPICSAEVTQNELAWHSLKR